MPGRNQNFYTGGEHTNNLDLWWVSFFISNCHIFYKVGVLFKNPYYNLLYFTVLFFVLSVIDYSSFVLLVTALIKWHNKWLSWPWCTIKKSAHRRISWGRWEIFSISTLSYFFSNFVRDALEYMLLLYLTITLCRGFWR